MEQIIGRQHETEELWRCYQSRRSEFVIVYGRRRIGKTFLINQTFKDKFAFYFTGSHKAPKERQLELFAKAIRRYGNLMYMPEIDNWYHAFDVLEELLASMPPTERKVVFFDEMPWIDTRNSDFVAALEDFWNTWAALRDDICFIACGSATSWMVDNLVENQGGLHDRVTARLYLRPFNLHECEQYLQTNGFVWDQYTITQCYMYLGGVPYYLSLLNCKHDLAWNMDMLFFSTHARLADEFNELYNVLFNESGKYIEIVRLLATRREGMTRQEIAERASGGGTLTKRLENLQRCDFIKGYTPFGKVKKGTVYRLTDFFTLFYLTFVEGVSARERSYWLLKMTERDVIVWQGLTFELICLVHTDQIIQQLGISGVLTNASTWRSTCQDGKDKHTQIDLVIERTDRYIYLCEVKFSESEYAITKEYEQKLRDRESIFRDQTKTRKTLLTTFITTFGIKQNTYSGIVQREVRMGDLFMPLYRR